MILRGLDEAQPEPPLDRRTVEFLDRTYPPRYPDPRWTEREVWMKAGERRLVEWLNEKLRQQEKTGTP